MPVPSDDFGDFPVWQLSGQPQRIAAARYAGSCPENDGISRMVGFKRPAA